MPKKELIYLTEDLIKENDIVAIGGDFSVENLVHCYSQGMFPWPQSEDNLRSQPLVWFCPRRRGILKFKKNHFSEKTLRSFKNKNFKLAMDQNFEEVINECQIMKRAHEPGTWITEELKAAYIELFHQGYAHSFECVQNDQLVGGLYGVFVNGVFSGESMFYKVSDASKFCIYHLIEYLKQLELEWLDTQMVTPVVEKIGGQYILREQYLDLLRYQQKKWHESGLKWESVHYKGNLNE